MCTTLEDSVPTAKAIRIQPEILAEQWFSFVHEMIGGLQAAYRLAQEHDPSFNQKVLAERVGLKPSFVSRCLSGQQNMTARTIYTIARGMDYRPQILFQPLWKLTPSNQRPSKVRQPLESQRQVAAGAGNIKLYGEPAAQSGAGASVPIT
jgi:plasmid maintenance system antidote protein VapI